MIMSQLLLVQEIHVNHIHLIGQLGADPRLTPYRNHQVTDTSNQARRVVSFDLAVEQIGHNPQTGEISTDWNPITAFNGVAGRFAADHLQTGDRVAVTGRLEANSCSGDDGALRKSIRFVAREIIELDYHRRSAVEDRNQPVQQASNPISDIVKEASEQ